MSNEQLKDPIFGLSEGDLTSAFAYGSLLSLRNNPDLILRRASWRDQEEAIAPDQEKEYTQLLLDLEKGYGIRVPRYSRTRIPHEWSGRVKSWDYLVTNRVRGVDLHSNLFPGKFTGYDSPLYRASDDEVLRHIKRLVPLKVAVDCYGSIIQYYKDVIEVDDERCYTNEGYPYLGNLSPSNCIYGSLPGDRNRSVYFVGIDPSVWVYRRNRVYSDPPHRLSEDAKASIGSLQEPIRQLGAIYKKPLTGLKKNYEGLYSLVYPSGGGKDIWRY